MIAIDVMGGDHAPKVVLEGALAAAKNTIPVALYGPQAMIHAWLDKHEPIWKQLAITIVDAPDVVLMDEEPVFAVRKKGQSSLVLAAKSVGAGSSSAVLSAGNSGALMAAAALFIGRQDGVERPAIAGFLPTRHGTVLALDLGANTECRPVHLIQFAHLASDYLKQTTHVHAPRVGLLSNGHEEGKGSQLVKETHALLKQEAGLNFVGNVEPCDIFNHKADIVVCDGFAGNVLLKTMESISEMITEWCDSTTAEAIAQRMNYQAVGGALLLGVKKPVIVCHGNADAQTLGNAITFAWNVSGGK